MFLFAFDLAASGSGVAVLSILVGGTDFGFEGFDFGRAGFGSVVGALDEGGGGAV